MQPGINIIYLLDSLFTSWIVNFIAIGLWRNTYNLVVIVSYTDDPVVSDCWCLLVGLAGVATLHALQTPLIITAKLLEERKGKSLSLAWEQCVYTIAFIMLITIWKGMWNLNIRYLLSDPTIGGWVHHLAGTSVMMLLGVFGCVGTPCCTVDGGEEPENAFFPLRYFSLHKNNWFCSTSPAKQVM